MQFVYCVNGLIRFYDELIGFCKGLRWLLGIVGLISLWKWGGKINEKEKKIILILMYPNEKLDASQIWLYKIGKMIFCELKLIIFTEPNVNAIWLRSNNNTSCPCKKGITRCHIAYKNKNKKLSNFSNSSKQLFEY